MKTRLRSTLTAQNLQAQLNIMIEGPSLQEFNPDLAIEKWLKMSRGRHIDGHAIKVAAVEVENADEMYMEYVNKWIKYVLNDLSFK